MERRQFVKEVANKMRKNMCELFMDQEYQHHQVFQLGKTFFRLIWNL